MTEPDNTDNSKQKVPVWFFATGIVAMTLFIIGGIINPGRVMNDWKLVAGIIGGIGIFSICIYGMVKKNNNKKEK
jgi:hypothetical protein